MKSVCVILMIVFCTEQADAIDLTECMRQSIARGLDSFGFKGNLDDVTAMGTLVGAGTVLEKALGKELSDQAMRMAEHSQHSRDPFIASVFSRFARKNHEHPQPIVCVLDSGKCSFTSDAGQFQFDYNTLKLSKTTDTAQPITVAEAESLLRALEEENMNSRLIIRDVFKKSMTVATFFMNIPIMQIRIFSSHGSKVTYACSAREKNLTFSFESWSEPVMEKF